MRVLIVDDEPADIRFLDRTIRRHYRKPTIVVRNSVRGGLEALAGSDRFDLVVTDYLFEQDTRDGTSIVQRALEVNGRGIVILTSSEQLPDHVVDAFVHHAVGSDSRVYFTAKLSLVSDLDLVLELLAHRETSQGKGVLYVSHPVKDTTYDLQKLKAWLEDCVVAAERDWVVVMTYLSPTLDAFDHIQDTIRECDVLLADLHRMRPNVFAEIGFAQALGKPIVLLSPHEAVPYNVSMHKVLRYAESPMADALKRELVQFLHSIGR